MENNDTNISFRRQACLDVLSLLNGEKTKEDFIKLYKIWAEKSIDYASAVEATMRHRLYDKSREVVFAKYNGISIKECKDLFDEQGNIRATKKIVSALFDVAYTRTPNNRIGGDGKPESWDRNVNQGLAAERALLSLSRIDEYSDGMIFLREEFSYPRNVNDYHVNNRDILNVVGLNYKDCREHNQEAALKAAQTNGRGGK